MRIFIKDNQAFTEQAYYDLGTRVHIKVIADNNLRIREVIDDNLIPVKPGDYLLDLSRETKDTFKVLIFKVLGEIYYDFDNEINYNTDLITYYIGTLDNIRNDIDGCFSDMLEQAANKIVEFV